LYDVNLDRLVGMRIPIISKYLFSRIVNRKIQKSEKSRENQKLPSSDVFIRRESVNLLDETSGIVQYTYQICTKLLPGPLIKK